MLNNKKKYIVLILAICIVLSGCSSISSVEFNEENAHKHIEQLFSNKNMDVFLQQIRKVFDENKVEYNTDNYSQK